MGRRFGQDTKVNALYTHLSAASCSYNVTYADDCVGSAEWVIWARIDAACVLYTFPLEKLVSLSRANPVCDSILNLDLFEPGLRVRDVAPFLRKKGATLCPSTSKALGQILRTCGMGGRNISIEHIACLVAR